MEKGVEGPDRTVRLVRKTNYVCEPEMRPSESFGRHEIVEKLPRLDTSPP